MANYTINQELNGIEISFEAKPTADTLAALKANGYRWHRVKKVWYAKQTPDRLALAESITGDQEPATAPKAAKVETINLENLGENTPNLYGAELAAAIREDLKKRGVKGATVRARRVTHETGITVTIKATAADIVSIEECNSRYPFEEFACDALNYHGVFDGSRWIYSATWENMTEEERRTAYRNHTIYYLTKSPDFNNYHQERKDYPTMTTDFYNKVVAIFKIANQWNYNHSDSMSDYFDVGYYLDIDIKTPEGFTPAEKMTDEEIKAYKAEKAAEEAAKQAEFERYLQEQEEAKERRKAYEEQEKKDRAEILATITVEDIEPEYITNLSGGIGKECNLEELAEDIGAHTSDAVITRRVTFKSRETFEIFGKYLLNDWDFVAGKGGTGSSDARLENVENPYSLNQEQRESVKFYMVDCVACYVGSELVLVINPEGYSYPRYCYMPTKETKTKNAATEEEKQRKESAALPPLYFPAPVEDQVKQLTEGQKITIYQCDGWNLCSVYAGFGEVFAVESGTYAQYTGVYITLMNGKKLNRIFIRDGKKCLIYNGVQPLLPDSVTSEKIDEQMSRIYNTDELFPRILDYYAKQGKHPIIDTIQR